MDMDKITKKKIKKLDNINLQQALKDKHDETNGLTIPQMAKDIGIPKSLLDSYIYGRKFPRNDVLEKIARYLDVDIEKLLPEKKAARSSHSNSGDDRHNLDIPSNNEIITHFIKEKEYPQHITFLRLLELSGYTYRYLPALEEEIDKMPVRLEQDNKKEIDQLEATFIPNEGSPLAKYTANTDMKAAISLLKEIIGTDPVDSVENNLQLELFVKNIQSGLYDDTDIKDLPLNIEIMKIKRSISPQKYDVDSTTFNDVLQVPRKVMSIVAFLEIEIDLITDMENSLNAFLKEL